MDRHVLAVAGRSGRASRGLFALLTAAIPASAESGSLAGFYAEGVPPLSSASASVEVKRVDEPLYTGPSSQSPKRGAAQVGARLPIFGASRGPGCRGRWFLVGPHAFICEEGVQPSPASPLPLDAAPRATFQGLPYRYFFVGAQGSFGYRSLADAEEGVPDAQYQPGFGVAVERVANKPGADPFGLTSHGFWIPLRDLAGSATLPFQGSAWSADLAWIEGDAAPLFVSPGQRRPGKTLERLTQVRVLHTATRGRERYVQVGESDWLRESDIVRPSISPPPAEITTAERWIDVDLKRQTAVAYLGDKPVFATLVSSGRGRANSESATPSGTFRLWVKLRTSDMDDLEDVDQLQNYAIEAVPWVMFFHQGYGVHGAFWHRRFGEVRSHGCVNLAPVDAERLFHWTSPRLLPGWAAVFPTPHEPGTLVRIRDE
jgi:hypothetical protein